MGLDLYGYPAYLEEKICRPREKKRWQIQMTILLLKGLMMIYGSPALQQN